MPKLPKQYKEGRDGRESPEKVDIDDELEKVYKKANRGKSREAEDERLKKYADRRTDERQREKKEREVERKSSKSTRSDRRRHSRSRSRDRRRRSRSSDRKDSRRRRSRSREHKRRRSRTGSRDRRDKEKIEEITKETGLKVPEYLAGSTKDKRTFLEKQAKRKLLWSSKKDQPITEQQKLWANLNVGSEDKTSKFQKLMGASKLEGAKDTHDGKQAATEHLEKQSKMFNDFEAQYNHAQGQTHFAKGKGFGG